MSGVKEEEERKEGRWGGQRGMADGYGEDSEMRDVIGKPDRR
jgi:hypothetical protein